MVDSAFDKALTQEYARAADGDAVDSTVKNGFAAQVQYWRRADGWITLGTTMRNPYKYQTLIEVKKMRPLPTSFGMEYVGGDNMQSLKVDAKRVFKMINNEVVPSWLIPFFKSGGHKHICTEQDFAIGRPGEYLMPREQIIEMNLHRLSWMKEDRPDLADLPPDVPCEFGCRSGNGPRMFSTVEAHDQHVAAAHKEVFPSQVIGNEIQRAIVANGGAVSGNADTIAATVAAVLQALGVGNQNAPTPAPEPEPEKEKRPLPDGPPNVEWRRQDLMKYITAQGFPWPKAAIGWTQEQLMEYIEAEQLARGVPLRDPEDGLTV